jgi:hypothetical protein
VPEQQHWETRDPDRQEVAWLLHWAGIAFLGVYLTTVLFTAWPIALLQPAWQQKISSVLHGTASWALVGAVLLVLAHLVAPAVDAIAKRVRRMRRVAAWAAVGFALLVPLQTYAGIRLLRETAAQEGAQMQFLGKALARIEKADSEASLRAAIEGLPGAPAEFKARFVKPVNEVRDQLLDLVRPKLKQVETQWEEAKSNRLQAWLKGLLKNCLVTLLYALAFAAIGQAAPGRATLLNALTARRPGSGQAWSLRRNKGAQAPGGWMDGGQGEEPIAPSRSGPPRKTSKPWGLRNKATGPVDLSDWVDGEQTGDKTRD